jgi:ribonucleoside-diphosphate reductase beta chain
MTGKMVDITKQRQVYKPFEYDKAEEFWLKQQQAHWLHSEVSMASDIQDFKQNLTASERNVVANVLKLFTQTEVVVNEYWGSKVCRWFPKPEIVMMASTFASFEGIHQAAYSYLNDSLGLQDYDAFLHDDTMSKKISVLTETKGRSKPEIAKSLAVFSAFAEGVALFSSFAILMSFARRNLLKGVGQIVAWSSRDEGLHSDAGCWLFRQLISENKDVFDDELKATIYQAARDCVALEDSYIDKVFELGPIDGLDPRDLKEYIRYRANIKLGDLGMKMNWKNLDSTRVSNLDWFSIIAAGVEHQDFFAGKVTQYSKANQDFTTIW